MVVLFIADDGSMGQQLQMLRAHILDMLNRCGQITRNILTAGETAQSSQDDIMKAEEAITRLVLAGHPLLQFDLCHKILLIGEKFLPCLNTKRLKSFVLVLS